MDQCHKDEIKSLTNIAIENSRILSNQEFLSNQLNTVIDDSKRISQKVDSASSSQTLKINELSDQLTNLSELTCERSCVKCEKVSNTHSDLKLHTQETHIPQPINPPPFNKIQISPQQRSYTPPSIPCTKCDFKAHTLVHMKKHLKVRHYEDNKLLFIGDSVSMNADFRALEHKTKSAITAIRTNHTPGHDDVLNIIEKELNSDDVNTLVLALGQSEISKLDSNMNCNPEMLRERTIDMAKQIFSVAEAAIENNDKMMKAVVVRITPRFDPPSLDPLGLKPQLGLLADSVLFGLWCESKHKERIFLGNHDVHEWSKHDVVKAYGYPEIAGYDGVHLYGQMGKNILTRSLSNILQQTQGILSPINPPANVSPATTATPVTSTTTYNPMLMLRNRILSQRSSSSPRPPTSCQPPPSRSQPASPRLLSSQRVPVIRVLKHVTQDHYNVKVSNPYEVLGN